MTANERLFNITSVIFKYFMAITLLMILVNFMLSDVGGVQSQTDKVKLTEVKTLTLFHDRYTAGRRLSPVPQLKCINGFFKCQQYAPDIVQCTNIGVESGEIQWECKASDLDRHVKFAYIKVSCEGYEHPDDEYIIEGSCGLEYSLEFTSRSIKNFNDNFQKDLYETSKLSNFLTLLIMIVVILAVYKSCTKYRENEPIRPDFYCSGSGAYGGAGLGTSHFEQNHLSSHTYANGQLSSSYFPAPPPPYGFVVSNSNNNNNTSSAQSSFIITSQSQPTNPQTEQQQITPHQPLQQQQQASQQQQSASNEVAIKPENILNISSSAAAAANPTPATNNNGGPSTNSWSHFLNGVGVPGFLLNRRAAAAASTETTNASTAVATVAATAVTNNNNIEIPVRNTDSPPPAYDDQAFNSGLNNNRRP